MFSNVLSLKKILSQLYFFTRITVGHLRPSVPAALLAAVHLPAARFAATRATLEQFACVIPRCRATAAGGADTFAAQSADAHVRTWARDECGLLGTPSSVTREPQVQWPAGQKQENHHSFFHSPDSKKTACFNNIVHCLFENTWETKCSHPLNIVPPPFCLTASKTTERPPPLPLSSQARAREALAPAAHVYQPLAVRRQLHFPDKRLIQVLGLARRASQKP